MEPSSFQLTCSDQITDILGESSDIVRSKLGDRVDEAAREFIERSPLVFLATSDASGAMDVSPKGDAPGFVEVVDSTTLLIPERKGNNLAFGLRNIIDTGRIGVVFVVPGVRETLRVNGSATINNDPELLSRLSAHDKPSLLCTTVNVEECFFHCGKALIRSGVWKPETWGDGAESLMVKQLAQSLGGDPDLEPAIATVLEQSYIDDLY